MKINGLDVVTQLRAQVEAYNEALVRNDLAALDAFFRDSPDTIRYGPKENLYGAREIAEFRLRRPAGPKPRTVVAVHISTFDASFAVAHTEFFPEGSKVLGRQTQAWVRFGESWKIVGAHVSNMDEVLNGPASTASQPQ